MFKIPLEDRNKMTDTKELVEAENYLLNAFLLKPAPLPPGRSGVADVLFFKGHTLILTRKLGRA